MKIDARIKFSVAQGPDPWDTEWGIYLPLDHIICWDVDGSPHKLGELIWPWTIYNAGQKLMLYFDYWTNKTGTRTVNMAEITPEREARVREMQFLMTRQIYHGNEIAPRTLANKLRTLSRLARFAEARSCTLRNVLTQSNLIDIFGESLTTSALPSWVAWVKFLIQLDPEMQLGFTLAKPKRWKELERHCRQGKDNVRQIAPLPTRIYAALINNLADELDDIDTHKPQLLAALREAIAVYQHATTGGIERDLKIGPALIAKYGLGAFLDKRGRCLDSPIRGLSGAIGEIFRLCRLQIHVFSGMRKEEVSHLPYHCMVVEKGLHGRKHCLIAGNTTKFNKGRRLRTKWVTTECDGFRAIQLAQEFANVIYDVLHVKPSEADGLKDNYPLFISTDYLPWGTRRASKNGGIAVYISQLSNADRLFDRLCPLIQEEDISELEEIDPFRAWRDEPKFAVGLRWHLTTHQLRRSLTVYANASGLVRLASLRRQLQHLTREMAAYYGRGSTFCKNFIKDDSKGYQKHMAVYWQDGAEEAAAIAFVREVLCSNEPMFGGAGAFYEHQRERGEVMSREDVVRQMKAGLLSYREGPLGGCTRSGVCDTRKGLTLIDTACATDGCKHLVGKHSKIVQTIRLKRAAMAHITPSSITEAMEWEDLKALERVEREWRPEGQTATASMGGGHG